MANDIRGAVLLSMDIHVMASARAMTSHGTQQMCSFVVPDCMVVINTGVEASVYVSLYGTISVESLCPEFNALAIVNVNGIEVK